MHAQIHFYMRTLTMFRQHSFTVKYISKWCLYNILTIKTKLILKMINTIIK